MMFSSRPPFNDDPWPWVTPTGTRGGYSEKYAHIITHKPRPEYDRPQHNPTNPILVEYRGCRDEGLPFTRPEVWAYNLLHPQHRAWAYATPEQMKHAHRVLTRLANIQREN